MSRPKAASVDAYLADLGEAQRAALTRVRAAILKGLPGATESISYGIPTFKVHGRMVIYCAAFTEHYSIYPATATLIETLGDALAHCEYNGKGTIRFPLTRPVPAALITRIARFRGPRKRRDRHVPGSRPRSGSDSVRSVSGACHRALSTFTPGMARGNTAFSDVSRRRMRSASRTTSARDDARLRDSPRSVARGQWSAGREYLYLWTASEDKAQPDFLAVLDVTNRGERYGRLVTTLPVGRDRPLRSGDRSARLGHTLPRGWRHRARLSHGRQDVAPRRPGEGHPPRRRVQPVAADALIPRASARRGRCYLTWTDSR